MRASGIRNPGRTGRRFVLLVAVLFVVHAAAHGLRLQRERASGRDPGTLTVETLAGGEAVPLRALADGRPLLLVFWATWCTYCKEQIRAGADLADRLAKGSAPVRVLFIDLEEPPEVVAADPDAAPIRDRIVLDRDGRVARAFALEGVPSYVLLDEHARPRWVEQGLQADVPGQVARRLGAGPP